ncbi:MAG: OmpA family protein [Candidatus Omnitrophica bacterium]|nr:OmpA family protein [Candidatus Omnitrophota bacterium]
MKRNPVFYFMLGLTVSVVFLTGCSMKWKTARERELESQVDQLAGRIAEAERSRTLLASHVDKLQDELNRLQDERARDIERLMREQQMARERGQESDEMLEAQRRLAESLRQELGDARAKLAMTERGLVLTFLDEIFFDSGKAQIKPEGQETLRKVAAVLKETVPDSPVAVEGHTDNVPIKYSGWKSNWELSAARALAVVHHFTEQEQLPPERLRAVGFGEYQPVASNDDDEGRRLNRRVEVVILPSSIRREKFE